MTDFQSDLLDKIRQQFDSSPYPKDQSQILFVRFTLVQVHANDPITFYDKAIKFSFILIHDASDDYG